MSLYKKYLQNELNDETFDIVVINTYYFGFNRFHKKNPERFFKHNNMELLFTYDSIHDPDNIGLKLYKWSKKKATNVLGGLEFFDGSIGIKCSKGKCGVKDVIRIIKILLKLDYCEHIVCIIKYQIIKNKNFKMLYIISDTESG
jgi:hypothetical protein